MAREQLKNLTEPMYYVMLSLINENHGYGIMQNIKELTGGRVAVGAGTLYALLNRFETEGIIAQLREADRKKIYQLKPKGQEIVAEEYRRLNQLVKDGKQFFDENGNMIPPNDNGRMGQTPVLVEERELEIQVETENETEKQINEKTGLGRGFNKHRPVPV